MNPGFYLSPTNPTTTPPIFLAQTETAGLHGWFLSFNGRPTDYELKIERRLLGTLTAPGNWSAREYRTWCDYYLKAIGVYLHQQTNDAELPMDEIAANLVKPQTLAALAAVQRMAEIQAALTVATVV